MHYSKQTPFNNFCDYAERTHTCQPMTSGLALLAYRSVHQKNPCQFCSVQLHRSVWAFM